MPVTNYPDGLNIGSNAAGTAVWQLGGTEVAITAAELNAVHDAGGISDVEFDVLDGATKGTAVASKALVMGAFKDINTLDFQATSGLKIAGVAVTSSAAELNYLKSAAGSVLAYGSTGKIAVAGTVVVPSGAGGTTFAVTGLSSIDFVLATPYGNAGAGTAFVGVFATKAASGGTISLFGIDGTGGTSLANGTATYLAIG